LAAYFKIDLGKVERERSSILKGIQAANETEGK